MTRRLLLTAAIVALALAPSIGTGTAQARGFFGGGFGGGFHGGFGRAAARPRHLAATAHPPGYVALQVARPPCAALV